jgi:hypothetical protein
MTDCYDIFNFPMFEESSDPTSCTGILKSSEGPLTPNNKRNHGHDSEFENSWEDFCLIDSTDHAIEPTKLGSLACSLGQSPAEPTATHTDGLRCNSFNLEQSWEPYGNGPPTKVAVGSEGKQPRRTDDLGRELVTWFGNPTNLPRLSAPTSALPFKAPRQDSLGDVVVDDAASDIGSFDKSTPSTAPTNRSDSFNSSSPRSMSSTSSVEQDVNEAKSQNNFKPVAEPRRGRRKSSATCSHSKHHAQVERTRAANRAAAHRYRQKRRAATDALESRVKELEDEKRELHATIGTLHAALLSLREEVPRYSSCGGDGFFYAKRQH